MICCSMPQEVSHFSHPPPPEDAGPLRPGVVGGPLGGGLVHQLQVDHTGGTVTHTELGGGALEYLLSGTDVTMYAGCGVWGGKRGKKKRKGGMLISHLVPMQSVPVSPPPMTTTFLPAALMYAPSSRLESSRLLVLACRNSMAKWTPEGEEGGGDEGSGVRTERDESEGTPPPVVHPSMRIRTPPLPP